MKRRSILLLIAPLAFAPISGSRGQQLVEDITKLANPKNTDKPSPEFTEKTETPSGTLYRDPKTNQQYFQADGAKSPTKWQPVMRGPAPAPPPAPKSEPAQPDSGLISAEFDIEKHCKHIGSLPTGGSYTLEQTCRNQEREALRKLQGQSIPPEIEKHCAHLGSLSTGGSYSLMLTCVQQEITAKNNLR